MLAADFEEHSTGSGVAAVNHPVFGTTPITPNVWHHTAVTYDGDCWQIYLDGVPETDGSNCPGEPPAYESWMHLTIGGAQDWNGGVVSHNKTGWLQGLFSGQIDEVLLLTISTTLLFFTLP